MPSILCAMGDNPFPITPSEKHGPLLGGPWGDEIRSTKSSSAHRQYISALQENDEFKALPESQRVYVLTAARNTVAAVDVENGNTPPSEYLEVVRHAPIVSVDLIIFDGEGRVLVGRRANAPARGTLFVPGGRVRKDESMSQAVARIADAELGIAVSGEDAALHGVYQHLYPDNWSNEEFGTHYVCFAHTLTLSRVPACLASMCDDQHEELKWLTPEETVASREVHPYVRNYFHPAPWNRIA